MIIPVSMIVGYSLVALAVGIGAEVYHHMTKNYGPRADDHANAAAAALFWPLVAAFGLVYLALVGVNRLARWMAGRIRQRELEAQDLEFRMRLGEETRWPNDDDHYGLGRR